jgi:hypothetical protein
MREIAEIELAIQGGTEKIEQLGSFVYTGCIIRWDGSLTCLTLSIRRVRKGGRVYA